MSVTERLRTSELFKFSNASHSSASWQAERAYLRASAIAEAYGLSLDDVLSLTPGFWDMHADPTLCWDGAATTILTIQYNLTIGTVGRLAENQNREDLLPLLDDLLKFRTIGQFCLTEVGHGLDAVNLETTATLLEDGTFDLHTPTPAAAKFMPPMVPVLGRPCVAVVFAQLIVGKEKRGIRPFLVNINDGRHMCSGITTKNGSFPVNHGITSFRHVRLPRGALLAEDVEKSPSEHFDFLMRIWRVSVGTLSLSLVAMSTLKIASHIAFFYSKRRTVGGPENSRVPILSFRTQQIPVFTAVARAYVLDAFSRRAIQLFMDDSLDIRVRHGIATCFKAATLHCAQESAILLSERCGAQGLFGHNQIVTQYSEMRGIAIAEGDILVLSIRLATELILGRYSMPHSDNSRSLLSKHEAGIMAECQSLTTHFWLKLSAIG
ncbi:hypothetical protein EW026_g1719 [Hermanssonia centrifuga]|uniref:Acyl-CoA oxidase C-alpha1 domain-containing protein n=1 Tax=Hermanssonia centrifuga TaxID=98765 RepID=A0A4S4KQF3_9APHY|nr:hypothetical protein EW026_g1719 [Hermanssonia centrifuga]